MSNWWTGPMPSGWEAKWDAGQNRYFFIDHTTKKTSWVDPRSPQGRHQVQQVHPPPRQMTQSNQYVQRNGQWVQKPAASSSKQPQYTETSFVAGGTSQNRQVANSALAELKEEMGLTDAELREFLAGEGKNTLTSLGVSANSGFDSSSAASSEPDRADYTGLISRIKGRYSSDLDSDELAAIVYQHEGQEWKIIDELKEKGYLTLQEKAEKEREERDKIRKERELLRDLRSRYPDISEDVLKMACADGSKDTAIIMLDEIKSEMEAEKRRMREAKAEAERRAEQERKDMEEALRIAEIQRKELEKQREETRKVEAELRRLAEEEKRIQREKQRSQSPIKSQSPSKAAKAPAKVAAKTPVKAPAKAKGKSPAKSQVRIPVPTKNKSPTKQAMKEDVKMKMDPSKWIGTGRAHGPDPLLPRGPNPVIKLMISERVHAHGPAVQTFGPSGACGRDPGLVKGPSGINNGPSNTARMPRYVV